MDSVAVDSTPREISDGRTKRAIWKPTDGNGDPNSALWERTRYELKGHPTWKIYCGDAPGMVNGVLIEPPKSCYLDDKAAYKILHWEGFTKAERGRYWRHDFGTKGELRSTRKHRGRPVFSHGEELAFVQGPSKKYRFSGADNPKDLEVLFLELAAQKAEQANQVHHGDTNQLVDGLAPKFPRKTSSHLTEVVQSIETIPTPLTKTRKRQKSTSAANLETAATKRMRHALLSEGNVTSVQTPISVPQGCRRTTSQTLQDVNAENRNLRQHTLALETQKPSTTIDLTQMRVSSVELCKALKDLAKEGGDNSRKKLREFLREEAASYKELAEHVHGMILTADVSSQDHGASMRNYQLLKNDIDEIKETLEAVLGEEWENFEGEDLERE